MIRHLNTAALLTAGLWLAAPAWANGVAPKLDADVAAGEEIYQSVCRNCHGPKAAGMASFPKLAGRDAEYLIMRLEQYRSGEKVGANTALMAPHAARLSDADITNIAGYISATFE